jgi:hypothetical protein
MKAKGLVCEPEIQPQRFGDYEVTGIILEKVA